jgi:hypothetical protein
MAVDRTVRNLNALGGASSNRVFNLIAITRAHEEQEDNKIELAPLFMSRNLNHSIILKHRLRADEVDCFDTRRALVTKIIIPFERNDLKFGGRSIFVGQKGFEEMLKEVGNYRDKAELRRDLNVLKLFDAVPSLDPFLLREHLRANDIHCDSRYFAISEADQQRMHDYAAQEVSRLTAMASGKGTMSAATGRMVAALLSSEVNEKLEPLRQTLGMAPTEFSEGVFSWRGFIYYKWCLDEYWPNLMRALRGIKAIFPAGLVSQDERKYLEESKNAILRGAKANSMEIRRIIAEYDTAYSGLLDHQDPKKFREFLMSAPKLFLDIGDKMGAISHITSFWNYRFPAGAPRTADAAELITIFQDFGRGLAAEIKMAA